MINRPTIQKIMDAAQIEDVVQDFVNLKKRGANMLGLCPFHNEKTPSFTVSPAKNIYKCFGCGKGGDPVNFIMEHESISYPEALKFLADKYGIEVIESETSQEVKEERQRLDALYLVNEFAKDWYKKQLHQTDIGKSVGLNYFKERGFSEEIIKKFSLGYAPSDKDAFTQAAKRAGYSPTMLKDLGLTSKYDADFFRDRVMFPIHSVSGKTIGFGGRIMSKNPKAPKYVNTPETDIYNKSKVLYGAYFAKKSIRQEDVCIMVEGYTDVISLHQAGIENVVSSSGTSLTYEQIALVKRYTSNMCILYDGDPAGIKAALRGLDLVLQQDMNVKVVLLPEGEDPDSFVKSVGSSDFIKYIEENEQDVIIFKSQLLMDDAAGSPVKQADMIKDIVSSIAKIPDPLKRSLYIKECAHLVNVDEQILINEVNKLIKNNIYKDQQSRRNFARQKAREKQNSDDAYFPSEEDMPTNPEDFGEGEERSDAPKLSEKPTAGSEYQERDIARILISLGHRIYEEESKTTVAHFIIANLADVLEHFENELYKRVVDITYERLDANQPLSPQFFVQHEESEIRKLAVDILQPPFEMSPNWLEMYDMKLRTQPIPDENFTQDSISSIYKFKLNKIEKIMLKNQEELRLSQQEKNDAKMLELLKVHQKLLQYKKEIAAVLRTVITH